MSSRKHIDGCVCPYCKPENYHQTDYIRFGKLDLKYVGMIFKATDMTTPIPPDEWIVFRAQDNALEDTLQFYLGKCQELGIAHDSDHIRGVLDLLGRIRTWRANNPEKCKNPDTYRNELIYDALEEKDND